MKKLIAIMVSVLLMLTALTACGEKKNEQVPAKEPQKDTSAAAEKPEAPAPEQKQEPASEPSVQTEDTELITGLLFAAEGYSFTVFDPLDDVLNAIGDPDDNAENPSCAYQGSDYIYYYDRFGFELTANDINGVRKITAIRLIDDTITTPEGIRIGMPASDAIGLLPYEYVKSGSVYTFTDGFCSLLLQEGTDGSVKAVNYVAAAE